LDAFHEPFQSLSGFQVRCNIPVCRSTGTPITSFNPYRVFKFVATRGSWRGSVCFRAVSIPIGFSSSLQHLSEEVIYNGRIVSIPIGFSSSLQRHPAECHGLDRRCFNPYRVFKFVATVDSEVTEITLDSFNPYRVFKFVATLQKNWMPWAYRTEFQSLSGFQVRCNSMLVGILGWVNTEFQSLSGFQVRCNAGLAMEATLADVKFQSLSGFQVRCNYMGKAPAIYAEYQFQSLSGFQVRCNFLLETNGMMLGKVSIPIGFSSSLQPHNVSRPFLDIRVSIPIGFSSSLQPWGAPRAPPKATWWRFNPYRVFKFVATRISSWFVILCEGFNPYRVFKFVATSDTPSKTPTPISVSIPIGFSSSLQQCWSSPAQRQLMGFNPYRVFKFVATPTKKIICHIINPFQSLSGFQVRCNSTYQTPNPRNNWEFQSLSGFQVRCNGEFAAAAEDELIKFQSLSGFQVRCNITSLISINLVKESFNPYRVFKFVATLKTSGCAVMYFRFNPYRVFKFVATNILRNILIQLDMFQSLSGFQVRCNSMILHPTAWAIDLVSIPIGFSSSLQLYLFLYPQRYG